MRDNSSAKIDLHVAELLKKQRRGAAADRPHLDFGFGLNGLAAALPPGTDILHFAFSDDVDGAKTSRSLSDETFSRLVADLEAEVGTRLGKRDAGSISVSIDLDSPISRSYLAAVAELASRHKAFVVVCAKSSENNSLISSQAASKLAASLRAFGLHRIDSRDVESPAGPLRTGAPLGLLSQALNTLDLASNSRRNIECLVWLCLSGSAKIAVADRSSKVQSPFLSILMRTQGTRPHTLIEALTCLMAQSDQDFELVLVGHKLSEKNEATVRQILEDFPDFFRSKVKFLQLDHGNRTTPLNVALSASEGEYFAILDDDDAPMAHWVETFKDMAEKAEGKVLRTTCVRQDVKTVVVNGVPRLRAIGPPQRAYPATFDYFEHLRSNQSPPMTLAFPRIVFSEFKYTFDETLTTTEDWDFLLRVMALWGVEASPKITSIYRWWPSDHSSRSEHSAEEWARNHRRIFDKIDDVNFVLPKGSARRIRFLMDSYSPEALDASKPHWMTWDVQAILKRGLKRKALIYRMKRILFFFNKRRALAYKVKGSRYRKLYKTF